MALRGTLTHWKTRLLAARLGIDPSHALGLLEALWHATAEDAPAGNIGRLSNNAIAMQMFTSINPDKLITALIESHHLDEHPVHRLLIHDWAEHADYNTKRKVFRNNGLMHTSTGDMPPLMKHDASTTVNGRIPEPEPEPEPEPVLKDKNTAAGAAPVSASFEKSWTVNACQSCWNSHRGPMKESRKLTAAHRRLFAARLKDGLTAELCKQVVVKMASTPHFRGETTGWLADFTWLLGSHKESGEVNFRKVLSGDYDPRPAKKKAVVITHVPSYKDFAHNA